MIQKIDSRFDATFVGLQIYWEEYDELEFLGTSALLGRSKATAATCPVNGKKVSYLYPILAERNGRILKIKYQENPGRWLVRGELTIEFEDDSSVEPIRVSFHEVENGKSYSLGPNEWQFCAASPVVAFQPRKRLTFTRVERPGQQLLRNQLISQHGGCQVTGTQCSAILEACHIIPVKSDGPDVIQNALLLRCDLHKMFDSGLIRFTCMNDNWTVEIDDAVTDAYYRKLHGTQVVDAVESGQADFLRARLDLDRESRNAPTQYKTCGS